MQVDDVLLQGDLQRRAAMLVHLAVAPAPLVPIEEVQSLRRLL